MFCQSCGKEIPDAATSCLHCGLPTEEGAPTGETSTPSPTPVAASPLAPYAGFWLRAVAIIIDSVLYSIVALIVSGVFIFLMIDSDFISPADETMIVGTAVFIELFFYLGWFLYFAILESSEWQASIGKKIVGLTVTDIRGNRLSFARAAGRSFGAMVSHMTLGVGYIMVAFTKKQQALHDMIADCLVLRAR
jgi:uncharacterized RDD family membrane protein YckC